MTASKQFVFLALVGAMVLLLAVLVGSRPLPAPAGLQPVAAATSEPGALTAARDLAVRTGSQCFREERHSGNLPRDIDDQVTAAGGKGWIAEGSAFAGTPEEAAAASGMTLVSQDAGNAWLNGPREGETRTLKLHRFKSPAGTTVWVVVSKVAAEPCPSGE